MPVSSAAPEIHKCKFKQPSFLYFNLRYFIITGKLLSHYFVFCHWLVLTIFTCQMWRKEAQVVRSCNVWCVMYNAPDVVLLCLIRIYGDELWETYSRLLWSYWVSHVAVDVPFRAGRVVLFGSRWAWVWVETPQVKASISISRTTFKRYLTTLTEPPALMKVLTCKIHVY